MGNVQAQQEDGEYFAETGHNVAGEFYQFFQSFSNPTLVFGFPITEAFVTNHPPGLTVQYFQRARFELYPNNPDGQRVRLTPLGSLLYEPGAPSLNLSTAGACRAFSTGYSVCYDFLTFYDRQGGEALFGNPVSAFEFQPNGQILQHFEYARLEWHPEFDRGQNIILSDLGRLYFDSVGEDPARLPGVDSSVGGIPEAKPAIISLRILSFVGKAITRTNDTQKVYIIVRDQAMRPVGDAEGQVVVRLPNGGDQIYPFTTNENGIGKVMDIPFTNQPTGSLVAVDVTVFIDGLSARTTTSFRIWR
jgi:hypothetical protein